MEAAIPSGGAGKSILQQLAEGITMPFWALKVLTIFPITGVIGLNHAAMHNQPLAILKAGSILISAILIQSLIPYYPWFLRKAIVIFSALGPWFMFDIFEVLNPKFLNHGFRLPLNITLEGLTPLQPTDGKWKLNNGMAATIAATFAATGATIVGLMPANIIPASISQNITYFLGGAVVLLAGVAIADNVMAKSPLKAAVPKMTGGGLPPLSHFADKLLISKDESYTFFGVLALVIMGGLITAASKT